MTAQSYKQRHIDALLDPQTPEERTFAVLLQQLGEIADRWANDQQMIPAIDGLGTCIIRLLLGDIGRLDPGMIDKAVRDTVNRAGGNGDDL